MIRNHCRCARLVVALGCLGVWPCQAHATPASAVFHVDQPTSTLKITVTARTFSDDDTQHLLGTINATFDLGTAGSLPTLANVTTTGANVTTSADYHFGLPQFLPLIRATAAGLVADVTTPTPPGTMTRPAGPGTTYQFDASQFLVTLVDGTVTVTGLINDMVDLAEEDPPLGGSSPVGTLGSIVLTNNGASGPYTLLGAALTLPVNIQRTVMIGDPGSDEPVDLKLEGTVNANASFYAALSGVPGDFNSDGKVSDADYDLWEVGLGISTGAMLDDGDANDDGDVDGEDFLVWQKNRGLAPPMPGASIVPEPTSAASGAVAISAALLMRRARRTSTPRSS